MKIIIDTDPGIDDTIAIFLALRSPEIEVVGLTSVFGNTDIENATLNSLRLVETAGFPNIPVAKGSGCPIVMPMPGLGTFVHGMDGMGNTNPPPPKGKPIDISAAQFIVDTVMQNPGEITLVPVGPLTNIGLALRLEPKIADNVKEVVIMGGAAHGKGNSSPVAEANIIHDPHAASIVFSADWQVTMVGLDVTTQVVMSPAYLKEISGNDNPLTSLIGKIMPCYNAYFDKYLDMQGNIHTHDPSAISYLINPDYFKITSVPIYVETEGRSMGHTIPDYRNQWVNTPPVNVCTGVNAAPILQMIKERLLQG
jgi:purine nucleosidase